MLKLRYLIIGMLAFFSMTSCMENDLAFPRTLAEFTDFQVENSTSVKIDRNARTVFVELNESANLSEVKVQSYTINDKARFTAGSFPEVLDLTQPFKTSLSMYYDFEWTIQASQKVSRYVKCGSQIGDAYFDTDRKEFFVYVSNTQRLTSVTITSMKLELAGSQIVSTTGYVYVDGVTEEKTEECVFPMVLDCTVKRTFLVESRGEQTQWTLTVIPKEVPAQITSIVPWCWCADVNIQFDGTSACPVLFYKEKSATEWMEVPADALVVDGINVSARLQDLHQGTEYEAMLVFNDKELPSVTFRTDLPQQLPNMSFDDWWLDEKVWYPYAKDASDSEKAWDSANKGAAQYIGSSTVPEYEDVAKTGEGCAAVRMTSKWAVVKFAAGNLYTGKFNFLVGTEGANLDWGVPFTSKPKSLKGWYKYEPKMINRVNNASVTPTEMDKCQLQVLLIQTDSPYIVQPVNKLNGPTYKGQVIDLETEPTVIARFIKNMDSTDGEWKEFEFPLEYRDYRTPTYAIVTAASSYLGDYFTGGDGSTMLIDEFEFVYE